ncbi:Protein of unknown function [Cotesia congregata]|uniref:Uncharacterized protein n=1 Tax=Cotesia congregata TaxID=51543 RepID=A0A8J2H9Q4_COTCN|nr:Protein of unknown function [Cotesia congregata]
MMNEILSSGETTDEDEVDRNFDAEAKLIIPYQKKSADRYLQVYDNYQRWRHENRNALSTSEENNLVVYFKCLSTRISPPTMWSIWSILKKTLKTKDDIDISEFHNVKSMVKNNAKGYKPKKSLVLTWDEVMRFINEAPDSMYLASKVILVFGICGATRCEELKELKVKDVEDLGGKYLVSINESKNDVPLFTLK